jgi:hypothetical protein
MTFSSAERYRMSRVYVVVGSGASCFNEKKFVEMMLSNSVYVAFLGNTSGIERGHREHDTVSVLAQIQPGVLVNKRRWGWYQQTKALIDEREVVFILPEKKGGHFYRGVASKPEETDVPRDAGTDTYWGQVREASRGKSRKFEREHESELRSTYVHQAVFPISGWERVEATETQKRLMLTANGSRFLQTFHALSDDEVRRFDEEAIADAGTEEGTEEAGGEGGAGTEGEGTEEASEGGGGGGEGGAGTEEGTEEASEGAGGGGEGGAEVEATRVRTLEEVEAELRVARLELERIRLLNM